MKLFRLALLLLVVTDPSPAQETSTDNILQAADRGNVLVAAHRGGYANDKNEAAPENSVTNLILAIKKGYDVYETDIQRTSDGVFVIVHDATLERETNGTGAAKDKTLAQLKSLYKRYRDGTLSSERVATLEELLLAGKGRILFKPDLKPGIIDHFEELAQLVTNLKMTDQVFLRTGFKDAKTIQIDLAKNEKLSDKKTAAIQLATTKGVLVETHIYGSAKQWQQLAEAGVRMFHTTSPDTVIPFLNANGWRKNLPLGNQSGETSK